MIDLKEYEVQVLGVCIHDMLLEDPDMRPSSRKLKDFLKNRLILSNSEGDSAETRQIGRPRFTRTISGWDLKDATKSYVDLYPDTSQPHDLHREAEPEEFTTQVAKICIDGDDANGPNMALFLDTGSNLNIVSLQGLALLKLHGVSTVKLETCFIPVGIQPQKITVKECITLRFKFGSSQRLFTEQFFV